ncbi:WLM domain-containing protein [Podospora fimiseda]|uniref:WLM domain-containing protein n=1 Tax=Podospora fimiseda TaxID=252190 RepID=A0AAN7GWB7_9PEZI|nr:WLM domain-containing protein [Podospora fimiseda]
MTVDHEPLVLSFRHLHKFTRQDEALHTLKRIASMVKPIMRARQWKVGELCEFYPNQQNLLGLNENRGQRILIRLRYPGDSNQFMPFESVVDTMLHELCHNVRGPHDEQFHALWTQLRDELDSLILKGYTGEGFLSKGHQLGGHYIPQHERLRQEKAQAERNKPPPPKTPGHKLGGSKPKPEEDIRNIIVRSIERRNAGGGMNDNSCANQNKNDKEISQISEQWRRNGFKTQAEEEAANDAAIAQAYWELVQEDERRARANSEAIRSSQLTEYYAPSQPSSSRPPPPISHNTRPTPPPASNSAYWACKACTLHNSLTATKCAVCDTPRPVTNNGEVIDLTSSSPSRPPPRINPTPQSGSSSSYRPTPPPPPPRSSTWTCKQCTNVMDSQWWSCSACGQIKDES